MHAYVNTYVHSFFFSYLLSPVYIFFLFFIFFVSFCFVLVYIHFVSSPVLPARMSEYGVQLYEERHARGGVEGIGMRVLLVRTPIRGFKNSTRTPVRVL